MCRLVLACVLLVAITVGRVVYLTYTGLTWSHAASSKTMTDRGYPDGETHP